MLTSSIQSTTQEMTEYEKTLDPQDVANLGEFFVESLSLDQIDRIRDAKILKEI